MKTMGQSESRWRGWTWLALILLGIAGAWLVAYMTRWGAVSFSDSTLYILSARSLLAGRGLGIPGPGGTFQPLTLHPPLYPLTLAALGLAGIDPLDGARVLAVASFGLFVVLVGAMIERLTHQGVLALLLSAALAVSPVFIPIFGAAMTESLFYLLGLPVLFLVLLHLEQPRRTWLFLAGVLGGLCFLARYPGVTWLAAGCLALLLFRRAPWKQRLVEILWLVLPAGLLSALWLVPLWLDTHSLAARSFRFVVELGPEFQDTKAVLIDMAWRWIPYAEVLLPTRSYALRGGLMLGGLGVLGLLALMVVWKMGGWRRASLSGGSPAGEGLLRLVSAFVIFAGAFLGLVLFSYLFAYPRNDLNERVLSPLYLAGVLVSVLLLRWIALGLRGWPGRLSAGLALLLPFLLILHGARQSWQILPEYHAQGAGYTSPTWRLSETVLAVETLEPGLGLISNESAALLFLANRPAYDVTELYNSQPLETFLRYGDGDSAAELLFRQHKAVLVIFPASLYWQLFPLYGERTQERVDSLLGGLEISSQLQDGVIYRYPAP